jgi:hypothetical protein
MLPHQRYETIKAHSVTLPRKTTHSKLAVFDLDETLIHLVDDSEIGDACVFVEVPGEAMVVARINIRPYAEELLR